MKFILTICLVLLCVLCFAQKCDITAIYKTNPESQLVLTSEGVNNRVQVDPEDIICGLEPVRVELKRYNLRLNRVGNSMVYDVQRFDLYIVTRFCSVIPLNRVIPVHINSHRGTRGFVNFDESTEWETRRIKQVF